ncbi:MAG TPA: TonB-dependent receptor [Steroidobacteraceae bacterium]|jgi:iron complex outermembrane receptor protein|nr:TonB-dependent receptor [Steroidobacteraceae bacterium]
MCPRQRGESQWGTARSLACARATWLALGAVAGAPGMLHADEAPQASASADAGGPLQEVIVYARRRAEPAAQTPVAISVLTGEELRQADAVLLDDVGRDVPNTHMYASPQSVSALDITMRGQTVNRDAIVFDPAVGLYVDGVYVASGQGAMATLLDIDSVEVLRGSQGTLFGRDNTGGSILLFTHRPDLDRPEAELATSVGDYGEFMGRAIVNVPVGDTFGLRFAFQSNDRDGFGSSVSSGQDDLENQHRWQARVGALWKPDAADEVYFTYERFEAREAGAILHPLEGPPPGTLVAQLGGALAQFAAIPGVPTVAFPTNPFQTDGNFPASDDATTDSLQLTATHTLESGLALKLILGYRHLDATTALDVDASTLPLADSTLENTSNEKSAELQLNDKSFGGRLDWVAGIYWFREDGSAPSVHAPASPQFLGALTQIAALTGCQPPPAASPPTCLNLSPYFSPLPVYEQNSVMNSSVAAYAHGEYALTEDWFVAAGLRRTDDRRDLEENDYVLVPVPTIPGNGPEESCTIGGAPFGPCPAIEHSVGYQFWSWELSTRYRLTPELNAYARVGRSQRSGGWNAPEASVDEQPFRPEQLTDFEVGLKADLFEHALLIDGDVFYGKYDDMQRLLAQLIDGTPSTLVTNAGRARISGAELETAWQIARPLRLQGSFGYTDARYQSFLYQPLPGGPTVDLSGNDFYQTPRYQASLAAIGAIPTAIGELTVRADYAWQDKVQFNVINDFNYQPSYGTLNGRVALASAERRWELALFGRNLADKRYAYTGGTVESFSATPTGVVPTPTIAWNIPGAPRTYGLEGTYRFNPAH